jgi:hypothetical protein
VPRAKGTAAVNQGGELGGAVRCGILGQGHAAPAANPPAQYRLRAVEEYDRLAGQPAPGFGSPLPFRFIGERSDPRRLHQRHQHPLPRAMRSAVQPLDPAHADQRLPHRRRHRALPLQAARVVEQPGRLGATAAHGFPAEQPRLERVGPKFRTALRNELVTVSQQSQRGVRNAIAGNPAHGSSSPGLAPSAEEEAVLHRAVSAVHDQAAGFMSAGQSSCGFRMQFLH